MKKNNIIIILIIFFLTSCEKELDFQYHDIEPQLVIEGLLDQEGIRVTLSNTTPMDEKIEKNYLTDGLVWLIDETYQEKIKLLPDINGVYQAPYSGKADNTYRLEISRAGKSYLSTCKMRPATTIEGLKFQWIKMPYDYVAVLQIIFKDLDSVDDCYWIKLFRNGEPYKWIISDDKGSVNGLIMEVIMTTRKDLDEEDEKDKLKEGDKVKVVINAISREMYDYLIAIENNSNGPTMFENDFCLGYFLASDSVADSIIFHPDDLSLY